MRENITTTEKKQQNKLRLTISTQVQGELNVEFDEHDIYDVFGVSLNELMNTPFLRTKFISSLLKEAEKNTDIKFDAEDNLDVSFLSISATRYCLTIKKARKQLLYFNEKAKNFKKIMDTDASLGF